LSAWIVLAGQENQQCQLMDISKSGAKITVGASSQVPQTFELAFTETATKRQACEVIWRRGKMIGVQFVWRVAAFAVSASTVMTLFLTWCFVFNLVLQDADKIGPC
jgi:PilZ domain